MDQRQAWTAAPFSTLNPALTVLDSEGFDLGPLVTEAAERHDVPIRGLLACLRAESNLNRLAERWGDQTYEAQHAILNRGRLLAIVADLELRGQDADVSFGLGQLSVGTAAGYDVGNGSNDISNILAVRTALFDRETAIDLAARHLAYCYSASADWTYPDDADLRSLVTYNRGSMAGPNSTYWTVYAENVQRYHEALAWADHGPLAVLV